MKSNYQIVKLIPPWKVIALRKAMLQQAQTLQEEITLPCN